MRCVEVAEVKLHSPQHERLRGCYIDAPRPGSRYEGDRLEVVGWALGQDGPAAGVELLCDGQVFRRVAMSHPRPDLAVAFPDVPGAGHAGFATKASVLGMSGVDWTVQAVLRDQTRVPVGRIRGRWRWREDRAGAQGTALVSVIVLGSGEAPSLIETIESVRVQTYPHLEVVVVGEGPADSSAAAAYPWVRWVRQEGQGPAAARNTGIRLSDGSYLVFVEPGDRLLPDALATGLDCLKEHPECAAAFGHWQDLSGDAPTNPARADAGQDSYLALLRGRHVPRSAEAFYCREVFEHVVEFAPLECPLLDYEMGLRVARDFPVWCHGRAVAECPREDAAPDADPGLLLPTALAVLRAQRKYLKDDEQRRKAYKEGVRYWRDWYARPLVRRVKAHLAAGEWKQATRALRPLLRHHPRALTYLLNGQES